MAQIPLSGSVGVPGSAPILGAQSIIMTDMNYTLTPSEWSNKFLQVTSSSNLSITRNIVAPLTLGQEFVVQNNTSGGQSIQIIAMSGAGVTIPTGVTVCVVCDGTDYILANGSGSGAPDASIVSYTPADSADWSPPPTVVSDALDQLANQLATSSLPVLPGSDGNYELNVTGGDGSWVAVDASTTNYEPAQPNNWQTDSSVPTTAAGALDILSTLNSGIYTYDMSGGGVSWNSLASLSAALVDSLTEYAIIIFNSTVPAGTYTMPTTWEIIIPSGTTIYVEDGAVFSTNPSAIRCADNSGVFICEATTTTPFQNGSTGLILDGITIGNAGSIEFFDITGPVTLLNGAIISNGYGSEAVISINSPLEINVYEQSVIDSNVLDSSSIATINYDIGSTVSATQIAPITLNPLLPPSAVPFDTVFQPGGSASTNVYITEAAFNTVLSSVVTPHRVFIDLSHSSDYFGFTQQWTLGENPTLIGIWNGVTQPVLDTQGDTQFVTGSSPVEIRDLTLENQGTAGFDVAFETAPQELRLSGSAVLIGNTLALIYETTASVTSNLFVEDNACIGNGSGPAIKVGSGATLNVWITSPAGIGQNYALLDHAIDSSIGQLNIYCENASSIDPSYFTQSNCTVVIQNTSFPFDTIFQPGGVPGSGVYAGEDAFDLALANVTDAHRVILDFSYSGNYFAATGDFTPGSSSTANVTELIGLYLQDYGVYATPTFDLMGYQIMCSIEEIRDLNISSTGAGAEPVFATPPTYLRLTGQTGIYLTSPTTLFALSGGAKANLTIEDEAFFQTGLITVGAGSQLFVSVTSIGNRGDVTSPAINEGVLQSTGGEIHIYALTANQLDPSYFQLAQTPGSGFTIYLADQPTLQTNAYFLPGGTSDDPTVWTYENPFIFAQSHNEYPNTIYLDFSQQSTPGTFDMEQNWDVGINTTIIGVNTSANNPVILNTDGYNFSATESVHLRGVHINVTGETFLSINSPKIYLDDNVILSSGDGNVFADITGSSVTQYIEIGTNIHLGGYSFQVEDGNALILNIRGTGVSIAAGVVTLIGTGTVQYVLGTSDTQIDNSIIVLANTPDSGVTISIETSAYLLGYSPATPGNWLITPTQAGNALDQLASNLTLHGNTAARPSSPLVGQEFFDTSLAAGNGMPVWWNGTHWVSAAGVIS